MCHQLGYPYAVAAPSHAHYGEGTGPIWLDDVQCVGNESDIFTCVHNGIGDHNCMHDEDASVECLGMLTVNMLRTIAIRISSPLIYVLLDITHIT